MYCIVETSVVYVPGEWLCLAAASLHYNHVWIIVQLTSTQYCIVMFLSTVTGEWSSPAVTGTKPPPLSGFSFSKVDSRRAVVYGGFTGEPSGDAYVLELDKWVCAI